MPLTHSHISPSNTHIIRTLLFCSSQSTTTHINRNLLTTQNPYLKFSYFLSQKCKQPRSTSFTSSSSITHFIREDSYNWNSSIRGFLGKNDPKEAVLVYAHMRRRGVKIDSYTLVFVIKACGLLLIPGGVLEGEQIHGQLFKMGFGSEMITQTALLKMYGLFGDLMSAQRVFDETPQRDLVVWNVLVAAYSQRNHPHNVILVLHSMINENVRPNEVTAVSIVSACSQLKALAEGKSVHGYAIKNLMNLDTILCNALIDMYAKCGCLFNARQLFKTMGSKNTVSWTSMINGYGDNNYPHEALALFKEMELASVSPDEITMLGLVSVCGKLGSFELGEWVDEYIEKNGIRESTCIANALIDMHAKCGNIMKSCRIFDQMMVRTLVSWTAMIQGLAMHGHGLAALVRFSQMQREGFRPDEIVFLSVMSACSHAGLVEEGRQCFRTMVEEHRITPWMAHYGSMVDLLCKAELLNEAFEFVVSMPLKPDAVIWRTLLGASRDQGNFSLARQATGYLLESEPEYSGNYVLKSNLHAMTGEWDNVKEVRAEMGIRGVTKRDPAHSFVEVN